MVTTWWGPQLNALLGSLVVAAGAWLAWDSFSLWEVLLVAGGVAGFLIWQGRTIGLVWAWATLGHTPPRSVYLYLAAGLGAYILASAVGWIMAGFHGDEDGG